MSRIIVVQVVDTWWTKRSRGGPLAVARNAIPDVAEIPYPKSPVAIGSAFYHHLGYRQADEFHSPKETQYGRRMPIRLTGVSIEDAANEVKVSYQWDCGCGAPERGWIRKTFSLDLGEWGQVVHNGRLTDWDEGRWSYQRYSVNVGVFDTFSPMLFTAAPPTYRFSAEALLR